MFSGGHNSLTDVHVWSLAYIILQNDTYFRGKLHIRNQS